MERARQTWTDERLDDLSRHMEAGFARIDEDLRSLRVEVGARFNGTDHRFEVLGASTDQRFDALEARWDQRFDVLERRLDALQRLMIQFGGGMLVATLATLVSVLATRG